MSHEINTQLEEAAFARLDEACSYADRLPTHIEKLIYDFGDEYTSILTILEDIFDALLQWDYELTLRDPVEAARKYVEAKK